MGGFGAQMIVEPKAVKPGVGVKAGVIKVEEPTLLERMLFALLGKMLFVLLSNILPTLLGSTLPILFYDSLSLRKLINLNNANLNMEQQRRFF